MSIQLVERTIESLDGEWVTLVQMAKLVGMDKEELRPIMAVLLETGLVNQKVKWAGRYSRYLFRRARVICPRCGYDSHE